MQQGIRKTPEDGRNTVLEKLRGTGRDLPVLLLTALSKPASPLIMALNERTHDVCSMI